MTKDARDVMIVATLSGPTSRDALYHFISVLVRTSVEN